MTSLSGPGGTSSRPSSASSTSSSRKPATNGTPSQTYRSIFQYFFHILVDMEVQLRKFLGLVLLQNLNVIAMMGVLMIETTVPQQVLPQQEAV